MTTEKSDPPSCILIVASDHRLNTEVIEKVKNTLDLCNLLFSKDERYWQNEISQMDGSFVLNFLSPYILRGTVLKRKTINFHPAPPQYPGRGGASYALFDGVETFGATAHEMTERIDAGNILAVKRFPIELNETCDVLFRRAEDHCLALLHDMVDHISVHHALPPPCGESWSGKAVTRKKFQQWLILDPDDKEAFEKKILAAKHPDYSGPYVVVHGHRFGLNEE